MNMNTKITEALQQFEKTANHYLMELDTFSMEQLLRQPAEGEWSLGQMVQHLIQSALYMQLRNIDQCLAGNGQAAGKEVEMTPDGKAVLPRAASRLYAFMFRRHRSIRRCSRRARSS